MDGIVIIITEILKQSFVFKRKINRIRKELKRGTANISRRGTASLLARYAYFYAAALYIKS